MFIFKKIRSHEKGFIFKDNEFKGILGTGRYWFFDLFNKIRIDVVSQHETWLAHKDIDMIVKEGAFGKEAIALDIKDYERALVWMDGRFDRILDSGRYVAWTRYKNIRVEIQDARNVLFDHKDMNVILAWQDIGKFLTVFTIEDGHVGVYFKDGGYVNTLEAGRYAFWMRVGKVKVYSFDVREKTLDISGQEIMTADKVSLRMNAVVSYRIENARKAVEQVKEVDQALYREAQLALRAIVGTRELDALLTDKNAVARDLDAAMRSRADTFGVEVISIGIRDIILHGEMKTLLNRVIEAQKASEANAIARREETAAVRSQVNTARLMEGNAVLMRLRELEVLEKIAQTSKLNVILGDKGLTDRVVNLL